LNDESPPRPITASLVLIGCAGVVAAHLTVLYTSGLDPIESPISALSRSPDGNLHGLGLSLFAMAQCALAALLGRPGAGWWTRVAQLLLVIDAVLLVRLAYYFADASEATLLGPGANEPLWLLASGTGLAMSFAAPGLLRHRLRAGYWNLACLALWIALVPAFLVVEPSWLGGYERLVGSLFVAWAAGLAVLLGFAVPRPRHPSG